MSTYSVGGNERDETGLGLKLFALFAGVTIPAVMLIGLWLAVSAFDARDSARQAAATAQNASTSMASMPGMDMSTPSATTGSTPSASFAGIAPANADAIATAHRSVPAGLGAAPVGSVAHVRLDIS